MTHLEELQLEYNKLVHAMQTGVGMLMNYDGTETLPKHLRTGINSALVSNGALVKLLVDKKIITDEEMFQSLVDGLKVEVKDYETKLSFLTGGNITLL